MNRLLNFHRKTAFSPLERKSHWGFLTGLPANLRPGFTLTELMVVMAIIVILAGILTPVVGKLRTRAKEARARREINILRDALLDYYAEYTTFPVNSVAADQDALQKGLVDDTKFFMGGLPDDPFNDSGTYRYYSCNDGDTYADSCLLFSVGPDRDIDDVDSFNAAFDADGDWDSEYDRTSGSKDGNIYVDQPIQ